MPATNIVQGLDAATRRETLDIRRKLAELEGGTATAWTPVAGGVGFTNQWADQGLGNQPCEYRKIGDVVELRGWAAGGSNTQIFTLPTGFRPAYPHYEIVPITGAVYGTGGVSTAGVVSVSGAGSSNGACINMRFSVL